MEKNLKTLQLQLEPFESCGGGAWRYSKHSPVCHVSLRPSTSTPHRLIITHAARPCHMQLTTTRVLPLSCLPRDYTHTSTNHTLFLMPSHTQAHRSSSPTPCCPHVRTPSVCFRFNTPFTSCIPFPLLSERGRGYQD